MPTTRGDVNTTDAPKIREPLLKRPLDIILSILMMILSVPVSLPIAMAIKLEDGGAVFYRQEQKGSQIF